MAGSFVGPSVNSAQAGVRLQVGVLPGLPVSDGQKVIVDIDEHGSDWLWSVSGAYGLPLAGLLLATGLATAFTGSDSARLTAMQAELAVVLGALGGLAGGIFAWRTMASRVLTCVARSLCLQSARIVAISPTLPREP